MNMGLIIKGLRDERHMTQAEFAKRLDVSPSYLSELESGKRKLNLSTIEKIAEKLNIEVVITFKPKKE